MPAILARQESAKSTDYSGYTPDEALDLIIPWGWRVRNEAAVSEDVCPSAGQILGVFAAVNILATALSLVFGNRLVVKKISCGLFGGLHSFSTWRVTWIIPLSLNLGANFAIAALIHRTYGFSSVPIGQLGLLFICRPRLSWLVLLALSRRGTKFHGDRERRETMQLVRDRDRLDPRRLTHESRRSGTKGRFTYLDPDLWDPIRRNANGGRFPTWEKAEEVGLYYNAALSSIVTEIFLQSASLYFMGMVANHAASNGFYHLHALSSLPQRSDALMMYAGALLFLIYTAYSLGGLVASLLFAQYMESTPKSEPDDEFHLLSIFSGFLIVPWVANWLFWSGFVNFSGHQCVIR